MFELNLPQRYDGQPSLDVASVLQQAARPVAGERAEVSQDIAGGSPWQVSGRAGPAPTERGPFRAEHIQEWKRLLAGSSEKPASAVATGNASAAAAPSRLPSGAATGSPPVSASASKAPHLDADAELIDRIRALEELKAAASAEQARAAAAFDMSQRRKQSLAGLPREQQGRGVAAQIALARRESPSRGGRLLGFAKALTAEMPCTLSALSAGRISEWRATLLVRETACLSVEDRQRVDQEVAGDPEVLERLDDRQIIGRAKAAAYRLDPQSAVNRAAKAAADRFVSCRPAPDTMTYLTGLLPVAQGVGVYAALSREADRLRAAGDPRGRGQIMADTLVERVTGLADAGHARVEVQLVMTDRTLLAGDAEPALIPGYGPVPPQWARDLVRSQQAGSRGAKPRNDGSSPAGGRGAEARNDGSSPAGSRDREATNGGDIPDGIRGGGGAEERWIRRLFASPRTGELVAMDSRARLFPSSLARFIAVRDQVCRMPWCGAPIRHIDHVRPHSRGGPTTAANGQGLCEACNQAKEAPGWSSDATGPGDSEVETVTPTGHRYRSTAPPLPGTRQPPGMT